MTGIVLIEIQFPTTVELPDGFEQALDGLVDMACKKWERENPAMTMWVAAHGSKMLVHPGMVDEEHPMEFDDSVYVIEVSAREDYTGNNPHNPDRDRLRTEASQARAPSRWKRKLGELAKIADVTDLMQMLPVTTEIYTREQVAQVLAAHQVKLNQGLEHLLTNP